MAPRVDPSRRAAIDLLEGVLEEGYLLSEMVGTPAFLALPVAERARAQRLATQTLRAMDRVDRLLKPHLRKEPALRVYNILRLGIVELCSNEEAPHGVVNDLVNLTGSHAHTAGMKGLVNAVLRRASADGMGKWGKLPVPRLPKWLRSPLMEAYGNGPMMAIEAAHLRAAPLDLTVKDDPARVAEAVGGVVLANGTVRVRDAGQVSAMPGFEEGAWWVQDAAASMAVRILAPKKGEKIADLCAAPGGKTLQLAASGAEVFAIDSSAVRMERVEQNLQRTGMAARIIVGDVLTYSEGNFDAVLLDAPCSATGTIRRHPDLPYAKDGTGISELIAQQAQMLDAAIKMLKPGGRLIYCTCSLIPDEGEVQIEEALVRHKGLTVDRAALNLPGMDPAWQTQEGGLRLRPDYWAEEGGMDGFYIAALTVA